MTAAEKNTNFIKTQTQLLGFNYCGIAKAQRLNEDAKRLESWLNKGFNGNMHYMENYFDVRIDPSKLVPNAKSVITLLLNYFPTEKQNEASPKISKYAYGYDYHDVIREKLKTLLHLIKEQIGVDSAPVLERSWAQKSGLGWIGKNGNLINKQSGSFFFIATLIVDLPLIYDDEIVKDFCGTCTKCIDSCPTEAIMPNKVIDGSKCISYYTIELKDALLPSGMQGKFDNWMFGCDVCQDVCPWNRFSSATKETKFTPIPQLLNFTTTDWEELTEESFKTIFKNSAIKRTKFSGIKRNLNFLKQ